MTTTSIYNPIKGKIRGLWQKKTALLLILIICCIAPAAAATPLTPDGGTGYTVSGSVAGGNISYTITAAGEYELVSDLVTTAENAITIITGTTGTIILQVQRRCWMCWNG